MAYRAHTGGTPTNYTAQPTTTFNTVLDDIVADVAAAVAAGTNNGWTLHDDQRVPASVVAIPAYRNHVTHTTGGTGYQWNASSTSVGGGSTAFRRWHVAGWTELKFPRATPPQDAWVQVASIASDTALNTATPNPGALRGFDRDVLEKAEGFVVLKCTSAERTFYVRIVRPRSYADLVRIGVWETWDAATHTGTNGCFEEPIRAYDVHLTGTTAARYVIWFLPDAFVFFGGGQPGTQGAQIWYDFLWAGNLEPFGSANTGKTLAMISSNTEVSGAATMVADAGPTYYDSHGSAAYLHKTLAGDTWVDDPAWAGNVGIMPMLNLGQIHPRGSPYVLDPTRSLLDPDGKLQFCDLDVYAGSLNAAGLSADGKRGAVRHVRIPVGYPGGQSFMSFGPAEDGKTYLMVAATYPVAHGFSQTQYVYDDTSAATTGGKTGWGLGGRRRINPPGLNFASSGGVSFLRYFLVPLE